MAAVRRTSERVLALALTVAFLGCSNPEATRTNKTIDPSDWVTRTPMPVANFLSGAAVANGVLYILGGRNEIFEPPLTQAAFLAEAYDPSSDSWTMIAPMPTPREQLGAASVNGIVYALGGLGGNDPRISVWLDRVEAYDPSTNTWSARAPMPTKRSTFGVGVVNGIVYAVGGSDPTRIVSSVDAYDPTTDHWTTVAPMSHARNEPGVGAVNGILYAIGGLQRDPGDSGRIVNLVEAYDPATNAWTTKTPMPTARYGAFVGVVDGIIYVVGGASPPGTYLNTVEAYDPATDTWSEKPPISPPRYFINIAGIGGHLFAVGGAATSITNGQDNVSGVVQEYTP